jgi:hypothetical protein
MPEIQRAPWRMNCTGIDLVSTIDRMPPGAYPYIFNCRVVQEGRLEARPGYSIFSWVADIPNSIRRLNDALLSPAYAYFVGAGNANLYAGQPGFMPKVDTGYSNNPLSFLTFRPNNSPDSWMYVYDIQRQNKFKADGTLRNIGVAPVSPPTVEFGVPGIAEIDTAFADYASWVASGTGGSITLGDRTQTTSTFPTVTSISYDSGNTGWACINVAVGDSGNFDYAVPFMQVILNPGMSQEVVTVREIHNPIASTTILAINYDSGTSGPCTIAFSANPVNIARNSLIYVNSSEVVRVLSVTQAPDGLTYSIRASTSGTHAAGESVSGLTCWRAYTTVNHAATEVIHIPSTALGGLTTAGTGGMGLQLSVDASNTAIGSRPISVLDNFHLSLFVTNPTNLVNVQVMIDIDPATTGLGNAFTGNYWTWTILPSQLQDSMSQWNELVLTINTGVQSGADPTLTFAGVQAIQILFVTTGSVGPIQTSGWYFFGTYGPAVLSNSPVGLLYEVVARDSLTGAESVPSPAPRYDLSPMREELVVTPATSMQVGVDSLDIYRQGGGLTDFTYVGTVPNNTATPNVFNDVLSDGVVAGSPTTDLTQIQPWPTLQPARTGLVTVYGTSVILAGGSNFDLQLLSGTIITINGVAYQTYGQPHSASFLEIATSVQGGLLGGVPYQIENPVLYGQTLNYVFGPLEGPFAPVAFGLGDPVNPGTLYYTNSSNLDSASDANTLEVCPPSEPLISGEVWNGLVFVGSRDNVFVVRYSYLTSLGVSAGPVVYQFSRIPAFSGMWSTWACCRGPDGVYYLGRDGIYKATEAGAVNISDAKLYPIFPHDGSPAVAVNSGTNIILPVDMTRLTDLRLSCCDQDLYFDYIDVDNNPVTLRYEITKQRWFLHHYTDNVRYHYLVEASATDPNQQEILLLDRAKTQIYQSGGDSDNGAPFTSIVLTPALDGGDERSQKLYIDQMTDCDGTGALNMAVGVNDAQSFIALLQVAVAGARIQVQNNIASLQAIAGGGMALYRNIAVKYSWTGGPDGPRLYACEPSWYPQPYLSTSVTTQFINLADPGWKYHRRLYAGLISTSPVTLLIMTQDGRQFSYSIPSTNGQFQVLQQMLDYRIKDLAFAYSLTSAQPFALFPDAFTIELKEWTQPDYIELAVFRT